MFAASLVVLLMKLAGPQKIAAVTFEFEDSHTERLRANNNNDNNS